MNQRQLLGAPWNESQRTSHSLWILNVFGIVITAIIMAIQSEAQQSPAPGPVRQIVVSLKDRKLTLIKTIGELTNPRLNRQRAAREADEQGIRRPGYRL